TGRLRPASRCTSSTPSLPVEPERPPILRARRDDAERTRGVGRRAVTVTTAVDGSDRGGEDRALAILQAVTFAAERIMRLPVDEAIDDLLARLGQATGATRVALIRAHRLGDE